MPRVPLCLPIVLCLAQGMLCVVAAHTDHAPTFRIRSIPPWHVSPTEARAPPPPVSDVSDARPRGYLAATVWHCVATSGAIVRFIWAPIVCLWEAFVTVVFLWPYRALATHARTVYELYVVLGVGVCLGIAVGLVGTGWLYMEHVLYRARVRRASG